MLLLQFLLPLFVTAAEVTIKNEKCKQCQFLVETFQEGLKKTSRHHFAGGDTDWEERNLGKYATSETRLIEITEGLCKKKTLSSLPEKYNGLSELEFKCSLIHEEHEEVIEDYYKENQESNMSGWLCIQQLKFCCADGHFGPDCSKCPGLEQNADVCWGHGACHGDGSRKGTGKCKCHAGYTGHLCRHCDAEYFEAEKTETSVRCDKCFEGCLGGCKSTGPIGCFKCRTGYEIQEGEGCIDVDECSAEVSPCQKANERCINSGGSYICECADGYKKKDDQCILDIEAGPPPASFLTPNFLRCIAWASLVILISLIYTQKSTFLAIYAVFILIAILVIEINVNPDTIPDEAKKYLKY